MQGNILKSNTNKIKVLLVAPKPLLSQSSNFTVSIDGALIEPAPVVRNLGIKFDPSLNSDLHIKPLSKI